jgi:hypothetical protein
MPEKKAGQRKWRRFGLPSRCRASACERSRPFQSLRGTIDEEALDTRRKYVHL